MDTEGESQTKHIDVVATKLLVARYIYPTGVLSRVDAIVTAGRDPLGVKHQQGAIGFDFTEIYTFICPDDKVVTHNSHDKGTFYWGQELTKDDLRDIPAYARAVDQTFCERFVLTDWGAIYPLNDNDLVISYPDAFTLPPDMQA